MGGGAPRIAPARPRIPQVSPQGTEKPAHPPHKAGETPHRPAHHRATRRDCPRTRYGHHGFHSTANWSHGARISSEKCHGNRKFRGTFFVFCRTFPQKMRRFPTPSAYISRQKPQPIREEAPKPFTGQHCRPHATTPFPAIPLRQK